MARGSAGPSTIVPKICEGKNKGLGYVGGGAAVGLCLVVVAENDFVRLALLEPFSTSHVIGKGAAGPILCYAIPGADGSITKGQSDGLNGVWYWKERDRTTFRDGSRTARVANAATFRPAGNGLQGALATKPMDMPATFSTRVRIDGGSVPRRQPSRNPFRDLAVPQMVVGRTGWGVEPRLCCALTTPLLRKKQPKMEMCLAKHWRDGKRQPRGKCAPLC